MHLTPPQSSTNRHESKLKPHLVKEGIKSQQCSAQEVQQRLASLAGSLTVHCLFLEADSVSIPKVLAAVTGQVTS